MRRPGNNEFVRLFTEPEWMPKAACRDSGVSAYFPARGESAAFAKATCAGCPVCADCLQYALDDPELHGIWGGTSERERRALRRDR